MNQRQVTPDLLMMPRGFESFHTGLVSPHEEDKPLGTVAVVETEGLGNVVLTWTGPHKVPKVRGYVLQGATGQLLEVGSGEKEEEGVLCDCGCPRGGWENEGGHTFTFSKFPDTHLLLHNMCTDRAGKVTSLRFLPPTHAKGAHKAV